MTNDSGRSRCTRLDLSEVEAGGDDEPALPDELYVVDVGDQKLVHYERDRLASEAAAVASASGVAGNEANPSESREFGEYLFRYGIADPDDLDATVVEKSRKAVTRRMRDGNPLSAADETDLREEFPFR